MTFKFRIIFVQSVLLVMTLNVGCIWIETGPSAPTVKDTNDPGGSAIFQTYSDNDSGFDKPHFINTDTEQRLVSNFYGEYKKCVAHEWSEDDIYLISYCIDWEKKRAEYEQKLTWKVNGTNSDVHYIVIKEDKPNVNSIKRYNVEVSIDGGVSYVDRLIITVVPPSTMQNFNAWYNTENSNKNWLSELPMPYHPLYYPHDPEPGDVNPQRWREAKYINPTYYHIEGRYEMRSKVTTGGHGHQAIYDEYGNIIRNGISAGTADKEAPFHLPDVIDPIPHRDADVIPFVWASQLDGSPCQGISQYTNMTAPIMYRGDYLNKYLAVRPPLANNTINTVKPTPTLTRTVEPTATPKPTATPEP